MDKGEVYDIILMVYNPYPRTVKVKKGVNKGSEIEHRNVVKELTKLGD
jgi:hypothetical protein